jgi:indolepyruvate ferredoxin oxidoreductase alpha subunit
MNVAYPVIDSEVLRFCADKRAVLMVEEGQPNFVEQSMATILRQGGAGAGAARQGLPAARRRVHAGGGEGRRAWLPRALRAACAGRCGRFGDGECRPSLGQRGSAVDACGRRPRAPARLLHRLPERPIFSAIKLVERELGTHHISADIGCHLFLDPAAVSSRQHDHGLRPRHGRRVGVQPARSRAPPMRRRPSARSASWATAASGTTA